MIIKDPVNARLIIKVMTFGRKVVVGIGIGLLLKVLKILGGDNPFPVVYFSLCVLCLVIVPVVIYRKVSVLKKEMPF